MTACLEAAADVSEAVDDHGDARKYLTPLDAGVMQLVSLLHRLQDNTAWLQTPSAVHSLGELMADFGVWGWWNDQWRQVWHIVQECNREGLH
jgi:hypothetical protein